ncbi:MAG TPA: mannose-6-phosphate isomerase [Deltaproteobacteria bacterium]|nr:mannose-6-phosphate isomerase [Deltaproteobacteria bacterium]|tara:strand:- start:119 stop:469 length:351 start_codon:yes stop_codon:yes gene_type:complete
MSVLTDQRPWGHYTVLANEKDHKVKRIVVQPGKRLSLQRHQHRAEHWYVVKGEARVTLDESENILSAGSAVDIPIRTKHRIENTGSDELVFIEVQTGSYFGEDDIERFDDDFGRAS